MNWYKTAKHDFEFHAEQRNMWDEFLRQEQDRAGVHFDLENNDSRGDVRRIDLGIDAEYGDKKYAVLAQMYSAGGDWENSAAYFKCQIARGTSRDYKFIFIPSKREGNANLYQGDDGDWHVTQGGEWVKHDERKLWDALKKHAAKVVKKLKANSHLIYEDPRYVSHLTDLYKAK